MDPLDVPFAPPPERAGAEKLPWTIVTLGLPLIYLAVLTVTELTKRPDLAVLYGPVGVAALGAVVCLLARMRPARALVAVIACIWWCLVAGLAMVAVDILIFPF